MKLCKTCNKVINTDLIAQTIWDIKRECMDCSSIKAKTVTMEEYEKMKEKDLGNSRISNEEPSN